jgi:hypothetical protein
MFADTLTEGKACGAPTPERFEDTPQVPGFPTGTGTL